MTNLTDSLQFDSFDPRTSIGMIASPSDMEERIQHILAKIDAANVGYNDFSLKAEIKRAEAAYPPRQRKIAYQAIAPAPSDANDFAPTATQSYESVCEQDDLTHRLNLQLAQHRNKLAGATTQIYQLTIDKTELQDVIEYQQSFIEQLKRQYNELQDSNRELRETAQEAVQKSCLLREDKLALDASIKELQEIVDHKKAEILELKRQIENRERLESLVKDRIEMQVKGDEYHELEQQRKTIAELQASLDYRSAELQKERELVVSLKKQLTALQRSLPSQEELEMAKAWREALSRQEQADQAFKEAQFATQNTACSVEFMPQNLPAETLSGSESSAAPKEHYVQALSIAQLQEASPSRSAENRSYPHYPTNMAPAREPQAEVRELEPPLAQTVYHSVHDAQFEANDDFTVDYLLDRGADESGHALKQTVTIKPETPQDVVQRRQQEFLEHQRERARSVEKARQLLEQRREVLRSAKASAIAYDPPVSFSNATRIKQIIANQLLTGEVNYLRRITTLDEMAGQNGHLVVVLKSAITCGFYAVARVQGGELLKVSGPEQMPIRLGFDKIDAYLKWNTAAKKLDVLNQKCMSQTVDAVTLNIKKKGTGRSQLSGLERFE